MNLNTVLISIVGALCMMMVAIGGYGVKIAIDNNAQWAVVAVRVTAIEVAIKDEHAEVTALDARVRELENRQGVVHEANPFGKGVH